MTIAHLKLWLTQDCDMQEVKTIVALYDRAKLDDDNYIVYYNAEPDKVNALLEKLRKYKYRAEVHTEVF